MQGGSSYLRDPIQAKVTLLIVVAEYNKLMHREYKIIQNDAGRYYVRCKYTMCQFRLNFNFRNNQFKPPTLAIAHDSSHDGQRERPRHIPSLTEVPNWIHQEGRLK